MKKESIWSLNLSTASLVLIPAAVGVNYTGKLFASMLKLPLWLDSVGTVLASMLGGPVIGAFAGLVNNAVYGLTADPVSFIYGITSIVIGLVSGVAARKGFIDSLPKAFLTGVIVAGAAAVVSTPINVIFWGGQTGNIWGDTLFAIILRSGRSVWLASFLDEIVVDLPDKIAVVLISCVLYKNLPKNFLQLYRGHEKIEEL